MPTQAYTKNSPQPRGIFRRAGTVVPELRLFQESQQICGEFAFVHLRTGAPSFMVIMLPARWDQPFTASADWACSEVNCPECVVSRDALHCFQNALKNGHVLVSSSNQRNND